jgi:hypothetical protein
MDRRRTWTGHHARRYYGAEILADWPPERPGETPHDFSTSRVGLMTVRSAAPRRTGRTAVEGLGSMTEFYGPDYVVRATYVTFLGTADAAPFRPHPIVWAGRDAQWSGQIWGATVNAVELLGMAQAVAAGHSSSHPRSPSSSASSSRRRRLKSTLRTWWPADTGRRSASSDAPSRSQPPRMASRGPRSVTRRGRRPAAGRVARARLRNIAGAHARSPHYREVPRPDPLYRRRPHRYPPGRLRSRLRGRAGGRLGAGHPHGEGAPS